MGHQCSCRKSASHSFVVPPAGEPMDDTVPGAGRAGDSSLFTADYSVYPASQPRPRGVDRDDVRSWLSFRGLLRRSEVPDVAHATRCVSDQLIYSLCRHNFWLGYRCRECGKTDPQLCHGGASGSRTAGKARSSETRPGYRTLNTTGTVACYAPATGRLRDRRLEPAGRSNRRGLLRLAVFTGWSNRCQSRRCDRSRDWSRVSQHVMSRLCARQFACGRWQRWIAVSPEYFAGRGSACKPVCHICSGLSRCASRTLKNIVGWSWTDPLVQA